jgi:hypothetical protein
MTSLKKVLFVTLLLWAATSLFFFSNVNALEESFSYQDATLGYFSVTSNQSVAKPDSVITVSLIGLLSATTPPSLSVVFHVTFSVDTFSQSARVLNEQDMVIDSKSTYKTSIAQVVIPADALNNVYVYATITNGTIALSRIPVVLVQNLTYSELQTIVTDLNSSLTSQQSTNSLLSEINENLQNQLTSLQTDCNNLLANCTSLHAIISSLTMNCSNLETDNSVLQNQLSSIIDANNALQIQLDALQLSYTNLQIQLDNATTNNTLFASQITSLQHDKDTLLSQKEILESQLSDLNNETAALQSTIASLHSTSLALQEKNNTTNLLMYITTSLAVGFGAATAYIVLFVVRGKGSKEKSLF